MNKSEDAVVTVDAATHPAFLSGHLLSSVRVMQDEEALERRLQQVEAEEGGRISRIALPQDRGAFLQFVREWEQKHRRAVGMGTVAMLVLPLAACGGGGGGGGGTVPTDGWVVDGYVSGARVSRQNGSGNEVTTDANGRFIGLTGTGALQASGGFDVDTGQAVGFTMTAPAGATVISPLTTLVQALVAGGTAADVAYTTVANKLGLTVAQLQSNPFTAGAEDLAVIRAAMQVANVLRVAVTEGANSNTAAAALIDRLTSTADLTDPTKLASFYADVTTRDGYADELASTVAQSNTTIAEAADLAGLKEAQSAPTVTISLADTVLEAGAHTVTFTFSEAPKGFTLDDIEADFGEFSDLQLKADSGGLIYTATYTPGADIADETATIRVLDSWTDALDNPPLAVKGVAASASFKVDTVAPADATITVTGEADGLNATEATAAVAVTVTPAADASIVSAKIGNTNLTATQTAGSYTFDATGLAEGQHTLTVVTEDAAGNQTTTTKTITIDTLAPADATIAVAGETNGLNATEATAAVAVTVTPAADASIVSAKIGSTDLSATQTAGSYTFDSSLLAEGDHTLTVVTQDAAGNPTTTTKTITIDRIAPSAPGLAEQGSSDLADGWMNGSEATSTLFRVSLPLSGALAKVGDTVELLLGGSAFATPKTLILTDAHLTAGYVDLSVSKADLGADGAKALTARITDVAGNHSAQTEALAFSLDTVAAAPGVELNDSGALDDDGLTNDGDYALTGIEQGATVEYSTDSTNGTDGTWSTTAPALADGDLAFHVRQTDVAGNVSAGTPVAFTLDTAGPQVTGVVASDVLIIDSDTGLGKTFSLTVTFDEAMDTAIAPTLSFGVDVGSTLGSPQGQWSPDGKVYTATYAVTDGNVDVRDITVGVSGAKDLAGNLQQAYTPAAEFGVATTNPAQPTLTVAGTSLQAGQSTTVTIIFQSVPVGFGLDDLSSGSADVSLGNLRVVEGTGGLQYRVDLSPQKNIAAASVKVSLGTGWTDLAGNPPDDVSLSNAYAVVKADPILVDSVNTVGANFASLEAALAASQSGDTIRIRGGSFDGSTLSTDALDALAKVEIAAGARLSLSAAQADGVTVQLLGTSGIGLEITGLDTGVYNFSNNLSTAGARIDAYVAEDLTLAAATDLGALSLRVEQGATLSLSAAQASGRTIQGEGTLAIQGLGATSDFAAIQVGSALATLQADLASFTGNLALVTLDTAGKTLGLTASVADGTSIIGSGSVQMTGFADALDGDFSSLTASSVTASLDTKVSDALSFSGSLGKTVLTVLGTGSLALGANATVSQAGFVLADGATLSGTAAQLSGVAVSGKDAATVQVAALANGSDLSEINANLSLNARVSGTVDVSANTKLGTVDKYTIDSGAQLRITDDMANNGASFDGGGVLRVMVDSDLAQLPAAPTLSARVVEISGTAALWEGMNALTLASYQFEVLQGATLYLNAAQADGQAITGAGTVTVTALKATPGADLSGLTANSVLASLDSTGGVEFSGKLGQAELSVTGTGTLTLAAGADLGSASLKLDDTATLEVAATRMDGVEVTGSGTVVLTGIGSGIDLSGLGAALTVSATVTSTADLRADAYGRVDSYQVANGATLTLSAAQADAATSVAAPGTGKVIVTGFVAGSTVDLSSVTATDLVVQVDKSVTISALDDSADIVILAGQILSLSAAEVNGRTISGDGTLKITGAIDAGFEFNTVSVATVDLREATGSAALELDSTSEFILTPAQVAARIITGDAQANKITIDASTLYGVSYDAADDGNPPTLSLQNISTGDGADTLTIDFRGVVPASGYENVDPKANIVGSANLGIWGQAADQFFNFGGELFFPTDLADYPVYVTPDGVPAVRIPVNPIFNSGMSLTGDAAVSLINLMARYGGLTLTGAMTFTVTSAPTTGIIDLSQVKFVPGADTVPTVVLNWSDPTALQVNLPTYLNTPVRIVDKEGDVQGDFDGILTLTEVVVFTAQQFAASVNNADITKITLGANITLDNLTLDASRADLDFVFGANRLVLGSATVLTLSVAEADKAAISGSGTLNIVGATGTLTQDLSAITVANARITVADGATLDATAAKLGSVGFIVGAGETLKLDAAAVAGRSFAGDGTGFGAIEVGFKAADASVNLAPLNAFDLTATITEAMTFTGSFGDAAVVVNAPLTVAASRISGLEVSGSGTLTITGLHLAPNADFSAINLDGAASSAVVRIDEVSVTTPFSGNFGDGSNVRVEVAAGRVLTLTNGDQLDGVTVTGSGTLSILDLGAQADLSKIGAGLTGQVAILGDLNFTGKLAQGLVYNLGPAADLTIDETTLGSARIGGSGNLVVIAEGSSPQLGNVTVTGAKTLAVDRDLTLLESAELGQFRIEVADGNTLTLAASDAAGRSMVGAGDVIVTGLGAAPGADLSGIQMEPGSSVKAQVDADLVFSGRLGGASVELLGGATLSTTAALLDGKSVSGDGSVILTRLGLTPRADLSGVTVSGSAEIRIVSSFVLDPAAKLGMFDLVIATGQNFAANAEQLDGRAISGDGGVTIFDLTASADLSAITNSGGIFITVTAQGVVDLDAGGGLLPAGAVIQINLDSTLALTAEQLGDAVVFGLGNIRIEGLGALAPAELDLSNVFVTPLNPASKLLVLDQSVDLSGARIGDFSIVVPEGTLLTLTAAQVDGRTITGEGSLEIVGLLDFPAPDTSNVNLLGGILSETPALTLAVEGVSGSDTLVNAQDVSDGLTVTGTVSNLLTKAPMAGLNVSLTLTDADNNSFVFSTLSGTDGNWSVSLPLGVLQSLGDGALKLVANVSSASGVPAEAERVDFTLATAAPAQPTIQAVATDNVINAAEAEQGVAFAGKAEAGATVALSLGGQAYTPAVDANGNWIITLAKADLPADGSHVLSVTATNANGNSSVAASRSILIDTAVPGTPLIQSFADDSGIVGDRITADRSLTLSLAAETGSRVAVYAGNTLLGHALETATPGQFSFTTGTLADGLYSLSARATDAAGNTSAASAAFEIRVDATAPLTPVITGFADNSGSTADTLTSDRTVTLSITAEAGSRVEVFQGANSLGFASEGTAGNFSFTTASLADGSYSFSARATDVAGNTSPNAVPFALTIDGTAPATPQITGFADNTGSTLDTLTADRTVTLNITAEAGSRVEVFQGTTSLGFASEGAAGQFSFTTPVLTDGAYSFSARAIDGAGNTSASTAAFTLSVDANLPLFGSALTGAAAPVQAVLYQALASDASALVYSLKTGLADDAALLNIDAQTGRVSLKSGVLAFEQKPAYAFTVVATDAAGNVAERAVSIAVIDDNKAATDLLLSSASIAENVVVGSGLKVGSVTVVDPDASGNANVLSVSGADAASFEIRGSDLYFVGASPNFEGKSAYAITITSTDSTHGATPLVYSEAFTINVLDVAESLTLDNSTVAENTPVTGGLKIGVLSMPLVTLDTTFGDHALFEIRNGKELFFTGSALDYEARASYALKLSAQDGTVTRSATLNIAVTDVDEADVTAPIDSNAATNSVTENAALGSTVGVSASATDADGSNNVVRYSLVDQGGAAYGGTEFAINAVSGVVSVAGAIDREAGATRTIYVKATSSDGSNKTSSFTIDVNDFDEFDVTLPTDSNAAANTVAENSAQGSLVGITAAASDADASNNTITYSLVNAQGGSYIAGEFTINASTGVVSVAGAIDREAGATRTIYVKATSSDGSSATSSFTINVTDVDEFVVSAPSDSNAASNIVAENAVVGTLVGLTAAASDADASNNTVSYSLVNAQGGAYIAGEFAVDAVTGVVSVAGAIDREVGGATRTIHVKATSSDGSSATSSFTININDVDEFDVTAPSDSNDAGNTVAENSLLGTLVGVSAAASDADASNNTISYSLVNAQGGIYTAGEFKVDALTGVVSVAGAIDREAGATRTIYVKATSSDGSNATSSFTINVTDVDESDVTAPTDSNTAANTVAENAAVNTLVGVTAAASDADATNNTVSYSLVDAQGGAYTAGEFKVDANTGVVSVAGAIDREEGGGSRTIHVKATSSDGSNATSSFTINVTDVNEVAVTSPVDVNNASNTVSISAGLGAVVGITASATDADATNNTVSYSLVGNLEGSSAYTAGEFAINPGTGVVTVAGALGSLDPRSLYIKATSADGSFKIARFDISVTDADLYDVTRPVDADAATNNVLENAASGTATGLTAKAQDPDLSNNTVTYSLVDAQGGQYTAGEFAIHAGTGVVTVASSSIDREAGATRTLYVKATSTDGSSSTQSFTINIGDVDEFDVTTPVDSNAATNTVAENAATGTTVGVTASASDADATNNTVSYSLVANQAGDAYTAGEFAIGASTGVVTVAGTIDREAGASRTIYVKATSADGSRMVQSFTVAVSDVDEFDVGTVTDSDTAANTVLENAAVGTTVGLTASATDGDATNNTVSYSLVANQAGDAYTAGEFAIGASTGVVTLAGAIDYEAGASRTVYVKASSTDGSSTIQSFTIAVGDVDEIAPTVTITTSNTDGVVSDADATVRYTLTFSEPVTLPVAGDVSVSGGSLVPGSFVLSGTTVPLPVEVDTVGELSDLVTTMFTSVALAQLTVGDVLAASEAGSPSFKLLGQLNTAWTLPAALGVVVQNAGASTSLATLSTVLQTTPEALFASLAADTLEAFGNKGIDTAGFVANVLTSATAATFKVTATDGSTTDLVVTVKDTITDLAGHALVSNSSTLTVDRVNPTVAISTNDTALKVGDDATITLTFSEAPATLPAVAPSAGTLGTLVQDAQNPLVYTATLTPPADTATASITFTVPAWTDAAGNAGSTSVSPTITVDTLAPTLPTFTSLALAGVDFPLIAGTAEAGSAVSVSVGGASYAVTADAQGAWSVALASATPVSGTLSLGDGTYTVSVSARDEAGNNSQPATQSLTIDTVTPILVSLQGAATAQVFGAILLQGAGKLGIDLGEYQLLSADVKASVMNDLFVNRPVNGYPTAVAVDGIFDAVIDVYQAVATTVQAANTLNSTTPIADLLDLITATVNSFDAAADAGATTVAGQQMALAYQGGLAALASFDTLNTAGEQAFVDKVVAGQPYSGFGQLMAQSELAFDLGQRVDALAELNAAADVVELNAVLVAKAGLLNIDLTTFNNLGTTSKAVVINDLLINRPQEGYASALAADGVFDAIINVYQSVAATLTLANTMTAATPIATLLSAVSSTVNTFGAAVTAGAASVSDETMALAFSAGQSALASFATLGTAGQAAFVSALVAARGPGYLGFDTLLAQSQIAFGIGLQADALFAVNGAADTTVLTTVLGAYDDTLGIDLTGDFDTLSSYRISALNDVLANRANDFFKGNFDTVAEFKALFDAVVHAWATMENSLDAINAATSESAIDSQLIFTNALDAVKAAQSAGMTLIRGELVSELIAQGNLAVTYYNSLDADDKALFRQALVEADAFESIGALLTKAADTYQFIAALDLQALAAVNAASVDTAPEMLAALGAADDRFGLDVSVAPLSQIAPQMAADLLVNRPVGGYTSIAQVEALLGASQSVIGELFDSLTLVNAATTVNPLTNIAFFSEAVTVFQQAAADGMSSIATSSGPVALSTLITQAGAAQQLYGSLTTAQQTAFLGDVSDADYASFSAMLQAVQAAFAAVPVNVVQSQPAAPLTVVSADDLALKFVSVSDSNVARFELYVDPGFGSIGSATLDVVFKGNAVTTIAVVSGPTGYSFSNESATVTEQGEFYPGDDAMLFAWSSLTPFDPALKLPLFTFDVGLVDAGAAFNISVVPVDLGTTSYDGIHADVVASFDPTNAVSPLTGTDARDLLIANAGPVEATGKLGADVFAPASMNTELTIKDFSGSDVGGQGDKVDLGLLMENLGYTALATSPTDVGNGKLVVWEAQTAPPTLDNVALIQSWTHADGVGTLTLSADTNATFGVTATDTLAIHFLTQDSTFNMDDLALTLNLV